MITYLHVKNIALIDELEVDFNEGLNILTGETGAGKSIIIGSINAVLGNKIPKDFLRTGTEHSIIEILFQVNSNYLKNKIKDYGIEISDDDCELLISRKIIQKGRSVFRINGQVVNTTTVKNISNSIIDIHSQHEHQSLLNKKNHLKLLDDFLGESIEKELDKLHSKYREYTKIKSEINEELDSNVRRRELDFLEFEINEIESTNLIIGEDKKLLDKYKVLSNGQKIKRALSNIYNVISNDSTANNASNNLFEGLREINGIRDIDSNINNLAKQLEQIDVLINDFSRDLQDYVNSLDVDEEELELTANRIDKINSLKTKYGDNIDDILVSLERKKEKYDKLVYYEENISKIKNKLNEYKKEIIEICNKISSIRAKGSDRLSREIINVLKDLNLKDTSFEVNIERKEDFDINGLDNVEFLVSTNQGEPMKPLIQIASGGELSRIMLAIKSVLADCDKIDTLIFDEIDTGISGRTAQMVAEKLSVLSKKRQLLCITHLPQIASMADTHYLIEKNVVNDKTVTKMRKLNYDETINELGRLIGGAEITKTVLNSAREMKKLVKQIIF
jgi:DNA repair protein RecN (Recombination protein N)